MEAQLQVRQPPSHRSTRKMRETILLYVVMVVVVFLVCVPIIWLLITSVKKDVEYLSYPIKFLPAVPQWSNYINVFDPRYDFLKHAGISAGLALGSSILTVIKLKWGRSLLITLKPRLDQGRRAVSYHLVGRLRRCRVVDTFAARTPRTQKYATDLVGIPGA